MSKRILNSTGELCAKRVGQQRTWYQKVSADGTEMDQGTKKHKTVPDGVSKRNKAIALEERHTGNVDAATERNLMKPRSVVHFENDDRRDDPDYQVENRF